MFSDLRFRVLALFRRRSVERELDEELQFHVARQVEKYVQGGMSREEATRRARIKFGGLELAKEECRGCAGSAFPRGFASGHPLWSTHALEVARLYGDGHSRFGTRDRCEHHGLHRI